MIHIGSHISAADGYPAMGRKALELGGDTFAFFPRNPRGSRSRQPKPEEVDALAAFLREKHFGMLVVHGAYTMNVCAAEERIRANSREMLRDDLLRLQALPGNLYNFHPGSHVGQGADTGVRLIAEALCAVIREAEELSGAPLQNRILLETMAGKGSEVGGRFEELREILDLALAELGPEYGDKLGVCFDTCHVWDAGYDIRGDLDGVLRQFWDVIGPDRLLAVHLNDSRNPSASRKDRHEKLGEGLLGEEALRAVVRHPLLQGLPFILETPNEDEGYMREIARVREWMV